MLHGLPRGFQQQTVLRIHRLRLALVQVKELVVEARDIVEECGPSRYRPTRHPRLWVVVLVGVPTLSGDFLYHVVAAEQGLPQQVGGVDAAWKAACHTDNCNRRHTCLIHCCSPLSRAWFRETLVESGGEPSTTQPRPLDPITPTRSPPCFPRVISSVAGWLRACGGI